MDTKTNPHATITLPAGLELAITRWSVILDMDREVLLLGCVRAGLRLLDGAARAVGLSAPGDEVTR